MKQTPPKRIWLKDTCDSDCWLCMLLSDVHFKVDSDYDNDIDGDDHHDDDGCCARHRWSLRKECTTCSKWMGCPLKGFQAHQEVTRSLFLAQALILPVSITFCTQKYHLLWSCLRPSKSWLPLIIIWIWTYRLLFSCPSSSLPIYLTDWLSDRVTESPFIIQSDQCGNARAPSQITSNLLVYNLQLCKTSKFLTNLIDINSSW